MHRRQAFSSASRSPSPPSRPLSPPMASSDDKSPRQRSLLTSRIYILLTALAILFLLTRSFLPSSSAAHPALSSFSSTPRNYLNASTSEPAPFDFCPVFGPGDAIGTKYGAHLVSRTRLHTGSGARIHRVLHKALSGLPVTISILGGSISACHGAGDDPISPQCYPSLFFSWWNRVFPHPASELTNGALRRTDSAYFSFCSAHHLPDQTDLVILDFDSEDPNDPQWLNHFELLVRSILVRPDQPAVLILGHYAPQTQDGHAFMGPELLHSTVAQFYDIPHISIKAPIYADYLHRPDQLKKQLFVDPVLLSSRGHQLLADMLISYFQEQTCSAWSAALGYSFDVALPSNADAADTKGLFGGLRNKLAGKAASLEELVSGSSDALLLSAPYARYRVPPYRLDSHPGDVEEFNEVQPFCVSANDLINPLPPSLFYGSGWHSYHPSTSGFSSSNEDLHYWYSTLPTSKVRIPIRINAGEVGVYYFNEEEDAEDLESQVKCWVDNNFRGGVKISNTAPGGRKANLVIIDRGVAPGSHYVECELLGDEGQPVPPFKIMGIFAT